MPKFMSKPQTNKVKIHLPCDYITVDAFSESAKTGKESDKEGIDDAWQALDVGEVRRA